VSESDFDNDLTDLFDKLKAVEAAVSELADLFWTNNQSTTWVEKGIRK
jgi:hypothetical protein